MLNLNNKNHLLGIGFILIYVLMAAVREVLFSETLHQVNIFILIMISFSIALIFFLPFQLFRSTKILRKVKENFLDILYLNITTALMWIAFIFALKFIEPAVVSSINGALIPVATLVFGIFMIKGNSIEKWDVISALGVLLSIIFLIFTVLTGRSGGSQNELPFILFGILGALVSGTITAINTIITKRLLSIGMTPTEMMSIRFFILIVASLGLIIWQSIPINVDIMQFVTIAIIAFIGIVIPLFCFQIGISKSDVYTAALLTTLSPLATFVMQIYKGGFQFSYFSLMGICLAIIFVSIGIIAKFLNMKGSNL